MQNHIRKQTFNIWIVSVLPWRSRVSVEFKHVCTQNLVYPANCAFLLFYVQIPFFALNVFQTPQFQTDHNQIYAKSAKNC